MGPCTSPYPSRDDLTTGQRLALIVAFTMLTPMTILFNGSLIYGLYKTHQYRNVFSRFIMVLSVSDFCIGLFVQPAVVYLFIPSSLDGPHHSVSRRRPEPAFLPPHHASSTNTLTDTDCVISWYLTLSGYVLLNFSGLVIFMVSIDRYFRLRKTHGYAQKVTIQKVNIALTAAFVFSLLAATAAYVSSIRGFFCIFNMVIIVVNFFSAACILNFYFFAWRSVRKRIASIRNVSSLRGRSARLSSSTSFQDDDPSLPTATNSDQQQQIKKSFSKTSFMSSVLSKSRLSLSTTFSINNNNAVGSKRVRPNYDAAMTRTVAAILVCCCTTYPPYFIVSFYRSVVFTMEGYCNRESHPTNIWFFWSFFLMFLNSVVNVVLYSCHNRQLKNFMKDLNWRKLYNYLCCRRRNIGGRNSTSSNLSKGSSIVVASCHNHPHATFYLKEERPTDFV